VMLTDGLRAALLEARMAAPAGRKTDDDLVFQSSDGNGIGTNAVHKAFRKACEAAGLPDTVKFHHLRHTYASRLIKMGIDVAFVSDQLGHANPAFTLSSYSHVFKEANHMDDAREKLSAALASLTVAAH